MSIVDSLVVQTAIGLVFVFATFAALVSVLTEAIARYIGLRGEYLLRGIRSLLDDQENEFKLSAMDMLPFKDLVVRKGRESAERDAAAAPDTVAPDTAAAPDAATAEPSIMLLNNPAITHTADKAKMPPGAGATKLTNSQRRKLPSYVSSRSFASALIDLVVPDKAGTTTIDTLRAEVQKLNPAVQKPLLSMLVAAGDDIEKFRLHIEQWYDDHMARVSGWYKRHVRWISLGIGLALVLLFNLNAVDIARSLYTDQALRTSVVAQATDAAECQSGKSPAECLQEMRQQIQEVRGTGLPIGWGTVPECAGESSCSFLEARGLTERAGKAGDDLMAFLLVLVGWALMVIALLPGARFWFDALARLGSLRSTGPKPAPSTPR